MEGIKTAGRTLLILLLILVPSGALYQWLSEQTDRESIPGKLVPIDNHHFHLLCKGEGSPLVLLENGLWGSYPDWLYLLDAVSEYSQVCSYDRLGIGWSSVNDKPTRAEDVTNHLNRLLKTEKLDKPIILVGFSAGGFYVRKYYEKFPEQIVGMVLLDSSHEQQAFRMRHIERDLSLERFCTAIAWTGVGRAFNLLSDYVDQSFSKERHEEQLNLYNRTSFCSGLILQSQGFIADSMMNQPPKDMGELPLVVIRAGKSIQDQVLNDELPQDFLDEHDRVWPQLQKELSQLSQNSRFLVAEKSGHAIQLEQPEIAIDAIIQMLKEYRSK